MHAGDTNGDAVFGVEGRVVVAMAPSGLYSLKQLLFVAHAGVEGDAGMSKQKPPEGMAPDGVSTSLFAGLGLGSTARVTDFEGRQIAFGLSAILFWPDDAGAFWFLGAALEMSYGFGLD